MVHRQRAVLLQFLLVIYLAALLKSSCGWNWLTNQTVEAPSRIRKETRLQNIHSPSAFGQCPAQINLMRLTFVGVFLFCVLNIYIYIFQSHHRY